MEIVKEEKAWSETVFRIFIQFKNRGNKYEKKNRIDDRKEELFQVILSRSKRETDASMKSHKQNIPHTTNSVYSVHYAGHKTVDFSSSHGEISVINLVLHGRTPLTQNHFTSRLDADCWAVFAFDFSISRFFISSTIDRTAYTYMIILKPYINWWKRLSFI